MPKAARYLVPHVHVYTSLANAVAVVTFYKNPCATHITVAVFALLYQNQYILCKPQAVQGDHDATLAAARDRHCLLKHNWYIHDIGPHSAAQIF